MAYDPIGPGSRAWNAFDRTLDIALATPIDQPLPKAYHNRRWYTLALVRHFAGVREAKAWAADLARRVHEETGREIKPGPYQ